MNKPSVRNRQSVEVLRRAYEQLQKTAWSDEWINVFLKSGEWRLILRILEDIQWEEAFREDAENRMHRYLRQFQEEAIHALKERKRDVPNSDSAS